MAAGIAWLRQGHAWEHRAEVNDTTTPARELGCLAGVTVVQNQGDGDHYLNEVGQDSQGCSANSLLASMGFVAGMWFVYQQIVLYLLEWGHGPEVKVLTMSARVLGCLAGIIVVRNQDEFANYLDEVDQDSQGCLVKSSLAGMGFDSGVLILCQICMYVFEWVHGFEEKGVLLSARVLGCLAGNIAVPCKFGHYSGEVDQDLQGCLDNSLLEDVSFVGGEMYLHQVRARGGQSPPGSFKVRLWSSCEGS